MAKTPIEDLLSQVYELWSSTHLNNLTNAISTFFLKSFDAPSLTELAQSLKPLQSLESVIFVKLSKTLQILVDINSNLWPNGWVTSSLIFFYHDKTYLIINREILKPETIITPFEIF